MLLPAWEEGNPRFGINDALAVISASVAERGPEIQQALHEILSARRVPPSQMTQDHVTAVGWSGVAFINEIIRRGRQGEPFGDPDPVVRARHADAVRAYGANRPRFVNLACSTASFRDASMHLVAGHPEIEVAQVAKSTCIEMARAFFLREPGRGVQEWLDQQEGLLTEAGWTSTEAAEFMAQRPPGSTATITDSSPTSATGSGTGCLVALVVLGFMGAGALII